VKIINIKDSAEAIAVFKKIGVDPYGIDAMTPKTINLNILIEKQPCKIANIIKQEMLSLGGDAAVARGSVACSIDSSRILIIGTIKQITAMAKKIEKQPFGLNKLAQDILEIITNSGQREYNWKTSRRNIKMGGKTQVMGILNVTPDSFSDGGLFYNQQKAIDHGLQMVDEGADIIDVGGESTRPGAKSISLRDELKRVISVVESLVKQIKIPISIDTTKAGVAVQAIAAGAEIVNDISSLHGDKKMAKTVRDANAALILMHMRGTPPHMQKGDLVYNNLMSEIIAYLKKSKDRALAAGIAKESIAIDPGIGFGKTPEDNFRIIRNLAELTELGLPIVIGTSRKSFIGKVLGGEPHQRIEGTAASMTAAIMNGCHIIRVHDVVYMKKVAAITDKILHS
jgi:dihydropteroate synthase